VPTGVKLKDTGAQSSGGRGAGGGRATTAPSGPGRAVQVDPMKPKLNPPGSKRLKLKYDKLLSGFAFEFYLRRYTAGYPTPATPSPLRPTRRRPRPTRVGSAR
jgi:hypothetical protein